MKEVSTFEEEVRAILETITDPEIPVLTISDLGIIREVAEKGESGVEVTITPTYSGCPAMNVIEFQIRAILSQYGYDPVIIHTVYDPPWTTDWIADEAKAKLKAYGIAPPEVKKRMSALQEEEPDVVCPRCNSHDTTLSSQFGSTPCKALYQCNSCDEPFDYFKCH